MNKVFRAYRTFQKICNSPVFCSVKCISHIPSYKPNDFSEKDYVTETAFAHRVLESNPRYPMVIPANNTNGKSEQNFNELLENANWSELCISDIVILFEKLSICANVPISHPSCSDLRTSLRNNCKEMTDDQLASVLQSLSWWPLCPSLKEEGFYELWVDLDSVCLARWRKWNLDKIFLFMELWYHCYLAKRSDFMFKATTKLAAFPNRLTKEHVVMLLFYLSVLRTVTKNTGMFELESRLEGCADELSVEELSVAIMGFFKSDKTLFNENLMDSLINAMIKEIDTVEDVAFTAIMKALRKSLRVPLWRRAQELVDATVPQLDRLSVTAGVHTALFTTRMQLQHKALLQRVSERLVENITSVRLKDMEKTVFPLTQLVFEPQTNPSIYSSILKELENPKRNSEIYTHPKSLIALIHYLCIKGIFSEKWIAEVLAEYFIKLAYGPKKFYFGRELLFIDCCVQLECPGYTGPQLQFDVKEYMAKRFSEFLPDPSRKLNRHQKWHYDVVQTAEVLFGKEYITQKYLLPHFPKADIIVRLDSNKDPLPLSESLKNEQEFGKFLKAPDTNYYAIIMGSQNMYLYKSDVLNGESACKLRQLKQLGYTPVVVNYNHWPTSVTLEKVQCLKKLIMASE